MMGSTDCVVLIVCSDPQRTQQIVAGLRSTGRLYRLPMAATPADARAASQHMAPTVIVLDESAVSGSNLSPDLALEHAAALLAETAPVVVLADAERQEGLSLLISAGVVDFVARTGNFISSVAGFIEHRMQAAGGGQPAEEFAESDFPEDFGEVLRHEVNNPLTGILGNAELLLAEFRRRNALAAGSTPAALERLQTIADLAVRLRETVRRLSDEWEARHNHARSA